MVGYNHALIVHIHVFTVVVDRLVLHSSIYVYPLPLSPMTRAPTAELKSPITIIHPALR